MCWIPPSNLEDSLLSELPVEVFERILKWSAISVVGKLSLTSRQWVSTIWSHIRYANLQNIGSWNTLGLAKVLHALSTHSSRLRTLVLPEPSDYFNQLEFHLMSTVSKMTTLRRLVLSGVVSEGAIMAIFGETKYSNVENCWRPRYMRGTPVTAPLAECYTEKSWVESRQQVEQRRLSKTPLKGGPINLNSLTISAHVHPRIFALLFSTLKKLTELNLTVFRGKPESAATSMFVPLVSTAIYSKPVPAQVLEPLYAPSAQGPDDIRTISVDSDSSSDFAPSPIIAVPVLPDIPDHSIPMPPGFFFDMIEFTRVPAQIAFWYALAMGKFAPNINTTPELNPSCTALDILVQYGDRVGTNTAVGGRGRGFLPPLHYAVQHDNIALVEYLLLQRGSNVNQLDLFGRTPLHLVNPGRRDDSIPKLLITRGADLVARDKIEQWAPLHAACRSEDTRLVRLLLEAENHLRPDNQTPQAGTSLTQRSPLFIASQYFRNNLLRLLLEHSKYRDDAETQCCFATPLDISILENNGASHLLCNIGGSKRSSPTIAGVCRRILGESSAALTECTNGQLHHMWRCTTCARENVCTYCALRCHMGHKLMWANLSRDPCSCRDKKHSRM